MTESDEREEWTLKICVSVCMSASATTNTLPSISGEPENGQTCPQTMITRPVLCVRQLMLLPSLAHGHNLIL